jgi:hypothetical protein
MKWYDNPKVLLPLSAVIVALSISRMFSCQEAYAQTVVMFKILPPGQDGQVQGVGRARYYLLDEYLKLAEFDSELSTLRLDLKAYQGIERSLSVEILAKEKIIKTLEEDKKILADRSLRLEGNWKKCEDSLIECSPCFWPYIVGAVGASVGLVGAGIWLGTR